MKNKTLLLLALPLTAMALSGCGETSSKIVLKIGFWPESSSTADVAMYTKWKERFEADYPQYEIQGSPYTYATDTIAAKSMTGQLPDVFQTWFTEPEMLKNKGYIRSVTSQVAALGWDSKMDSGMKETLTFDGELYGVPRDGYGLGLLINKEILGENDILPQKKDGAYSLYELKADGTEDSSKPLYPQTWDDVYSICETIAENEDSIKGFMMYAANKNGGWVFSNIAWNYGAELETKQADGKVVANLDCDAAVQALTLLKDMYWDEYITRSPNLVYNDWIANIGSRVAMAVVGSDVLQEAKLSGGVDMNKLAYVPIPAQGNNPNYCLYGGTPFVFNKTCSDEKVEGILRFLDYIGRSPSTSETNFTAKKEGYEVAVSKNQPILPTINPWTDEAYREKADALEEQYVNVNMTDYGPFFNNVYQNLHQEEKYCTQEMYKALDTALQTCFTKQDADPKAQLTTAKATLQNYLDSEVNK